MFNKSHIDYLAAWCRDLSFGNYAGIDHKLLRAFVAVDLANAIDNVTPRFDGATFVAKCGVRQEDI
jgi:hypothetical protein